MKYLKNISFFITKESIVTNIQREELLDFAAGYTTREDAIEDFDNLNNYYDKLPDNVILHRVVFLDDIKDLDENALGQHWIEDEIDNDLIKRLKEINDINTNPYFIVAEFKKTDIDFFETLNNNMNFPNEEEITLKSDNIKPQTYKIYTHRNYSKR